ncbi:MAG: hypothetical protein H0V56_03600 [Chthoniobacterales bacterium]|nr:hypothetical protein [Chthoniobacterales bacterium]
MRARYPALRQRPTLRCTARHQLSTTKPPRIWTHSRLVMRFFVRPAQIEAVSATAGFLAQGQKERTNSMNSHLSNSEQGIIIPAILWWLGVPLTVVLILWLLVF